MTRRAFSLIELVTVMAIVSALTAMSIPTTLRAVHKARVATAADHIIRAQGTARRLALIAKPEVTASGSLPKSYGVALHPATAGAAAYVVVLYGTSVNDVLRVDADGDGVVSATEPEMLRLALPGDVDVLAGFNGSSPATLTTTLVWWYQPMSGNVVRTPGDSLMIGVGTPAQAAQAERTLASSPYASANSDVLSLRMPAVACSPVCSSLIVHRGDLNTAVAIYPCGLATREEL